MTVQPLPSQPAPGEAVQEASFVPRPMCANCGRPSVVCLCEHILPIETRTRVVILQHPRESAVPIGTARLAELGLKNSERLVGVDFEDSAAVKRALSDPDAPPVVLFPGAQASPLRELPPGTSVTLIVIDGTWSQAEKILKKNPSIARLPRHALEPSSPSRYRIRRAPSAHCISTIEAIVHALTTLEGEQCRARTALAPFDAMVEQQLSFKVERGVRRHVKRARPSRGNRIYTHVAEREPDLVVAYGEANAWPRGSALGGRGELVHWAAEHLSSGRRFSAFITPERALSTTFTTHTKIAAEAVLGGESRESFLQRWEAFTRSSTLLCIWGQFPSELLKGAGAPPLEALDVRTAARNILRQSPGDIEECARRLGQAPSEAWVEGRTGVRLAAVTAVTRALLSGAKMGQAVR
jgi:DTW domain-containing protein